MDIQNHDKKLNAANIRTLKLHKYLRYFSALVYLSIPPTFVVFMQFDRPDIALIASSLLMIIGVSTTYQLMNFKCPQCKQLFITPNKIIGFWPPLETFQRKCKECGLSDKTLS